MVEGRPWPSALWPTGHDGPATTGDNGEYVFANLPVLKDGESYTVTIHQEDSAEALKPYIPTTSNTGDRDGDSSDGSATSAGLTNDGDRDPTLDFGFVIEEVPTDPVVPVDPETPVYPELPNTGDEGGEPKKPESGLASTGFTALGIGAAGLLLIGAGFVLVRRRKLS